MPASSPARTVSRNVTGNILPPRSAKLADSERPPSTSLATCSRMRLRGLSVILSAISSTVRRMGTPAFRMTENWRHISMNALSFSLFPPMSMLRKFAALLFPCTGAICTTME